MSSGDASASGLFLNCKSINRNLELLVDTGASGSLMSEKTYRSLEPRSRSTITKFPFKVYNASDEPMNIIGSSTVRLTIDGTEVNQEFMIADFDGDGILGLDSLRYHKCVLDTTTGSLKWTYGELPLDEEGVRRTPHVAHCKLTPDGQFIIPGNCEVILPGKLSRSMTRHRFGLVEPSVVFMETTPLIMAAGVVSPEGRTVPLRLLNPSSNSVVVDSSTVVGIYAHVDAIGLQAYLEAPDEPGAPDDVRGARDVHINVVTSAPPSKQTELPPELEDMYQRSSEHLSSNQLKELRSLLLTHVDAFKLEGGAMGNTDVAEHVIDTGDHAPIKQAPRRTPATLRPVVEQEVQQLLDNDIIEPSQSPWASPIVLVKKKSGEIRFCVDYRKLNFCTKKDGFPLVRIDDTLDALSDSIYYSTFDLDQAYFQVGIRGEDREKTAFVTHNGQWQFKVMGFGLCNAPSTFNRVMTRVLGKLQFSQCLIYLDDIIVHAKSFEEHLSRVDTVFELIKRSGLRLKPKKCTMFQKRVNFLGYVVSEDGVETDGEKIKRVSEWSTPRCVREVRSFVGLCNYYRRFVPDFGEICRPLHELTEKNVKFRWTADCQRAFDTLKHLLTSAPVLAYPKDEGQYILDTDASEFGTGAVLSQVQDGQERVIAYASSTLSKPERKYCVTRKEMLALVRFTKHFRPYLYGRHFLIRTDHNSLRWLFNFREPEGQVARWLDELSEYQFDVEHRPGRLHANADSLSRMECPQCHTQICPSVEPAVAPGQDDGDTPSAAGLSIQKVQVEIVTQTPNWFASETPTSLRERQLEDPDIQQIVQMLEADENPPKHPWKLISPLGETAKALIRPRLGWLPGAPCGMKS